MAEGAADIGAVLFQDQKGKAGCLAALAGVGGVLLLGGALVAAGVVSIDKDLNLAIGAGVAVVGLLLTAWGVRGLLRGTLAITYHEGGAVAQRKGVASTFRYEDVRDLAWGVQVSPEMTVSNLSFRAPGFDEVIEASNFDAKSTKSPTLDELLNLRERMITAVAKRLRSQLAAGESVRWTDELQMTRKGLEVKGKVVPWKEVDRCDVDDNTGRFKLFLKGAPEPAAAGKITAPGFLPAWRLFEAVRPKG